MAAPTPSATGAYYSAGPALSLGGSVQMAPQVGRANDPFEREADGVADQVTSGQPASEITSVPPGGLPDPLQRAAMEPEPTEDEQVAPALRIQRQAQPDAAETPPRPPTPADEPAAVEPAPAESAVDEKVRNEVSLPVVQRQAEEPDEERQPTPQVQPFLVQRCGSGEPCGQDEESGPEVQPFLVQRCGGEESCGCGEESDSEVQASLIQRHAEQSEEEEAESDTVQPYLVQRCGDVPCDCGEDTAPAGPEESGDESDATVQADAVGIGASTPGDVGATGHSADASTGHEAVPGAGRSGGGNPLGAQIEQSQGRGEPLHESTRGRMEAAFGADLSGVRVHTDGDAAQISQSLGAHAFTHQSDIYFNTGAYDPHSLSGQRLLAHELTHTVQQGATESAHGDDGSLQPSLIQRDADCEAEEQPAGSAEQAQDAETAPATGVCTVTNGPAEQPPEGTEEPDREETPADVQAREGAPAAARQANAPSPNEGAPEGEEGIAQEGAEAAEQPLDPCAQREAAGLGGGASGASPGATGAPASGGAAATTPGPVSAAPAASGATAQTPAGPTEGAAPGAESTQTEAANASTSFLDQAISSAAGAPSPDGQGEAASPGVVGERDDFAMTAGNALASLDETSALAESVAGDVAFFPRGVELDDPNRRGASTMASRFLNEAGNEIGSFIERGRHAAEALREDTAQKRADLEAEIQRVRMDTQGLAAQLRAEAQGRADAGIQNIEARHGDLLATIEERALDAQTQIGPVYDAQVDLLEQARTDQYDNLDAAYAKGHKDLVAVGDDKNQQAVTRAAVHERAYRNADNAPEVIQKRVRKHKKDGFWDGYLNYNRYMARADAATEVGKQFGEGFQTEAKKQADNLLCGKPRDVEIVGLIADQGLKTLGCARDNALDSIESQRLSAIDLAEQSRQSALDTIQHSLTATLAQLDSREASQLALLSDYGIRQVVALERDTERAAGTVLQGVNDAAQQLVSFLGEFRAGVESALAPPVAAYTSQIEETRSRLSGALAGAQAAADEAMTTAQSGLDDGQRQALDALGGLYGRGADELQQLGDGFIQSINDLEIATISGYDDTQAAFEERIDGEIENSSKILAGIVTGLTGIFTQITAGITARFDESTSKTSTAFQQRLDAELDQKVCVQAEKAAADVQPWWKTALKVLLIIVVIIVVAVVLGPAIIAAVGGAAAALAGSLGAGAALAGAIGAWVGPIIGGAIVGALAGAAIQVGSNAIYGKPLTEGLKNAVIAGAIGGALGGLGGQLGQVLVGRFASTALSRIAIQYGTDAVFNAAGSIVGDLATHGTISWSGVLTGLAIGGAVSVSMGGLSGLARVRVSGAAGRTAGGATEGTVSRIASGRLGAFAERVAGVQQRIGAAGERLGARASFGAKAPTVTSTRGALAGARSRMEAGEFFPSGPRPAAPSAGAPVAAPEPVARPAEPAEPTARPSEATEPTARPTEPAQPAPREAVEPTARPTEPVEPTTRPAGEEPTDGRPGAPEEPVTSRPGTEEPIPPGSDPLTPRRREVSRSTDPNDPQVRAEIDELGPMTPETRQQLAENPSLRQALLENPAAARALKRCASPCFPTNMDPADVQRLGELLAANPDINASRLADYLYANRGTPANLKSAVDALAAAPSPKAFVDSVALPNRVTGATNLDPNVVARLEAQGLTKAAFDDLTALGYPSELLQQALLQFKPVRAEGDFQNLVSLLRGYGTGPKPAALVQALEQIGAGGAVSQTASDFLGRVGNMAQEPSLHPLDINSLRIRFDAGDVLLAQGHLQTGMLPTKEHVLLEGYILQEATLGSPSKQLSKDWGGGVDFVIVDRGSGLELVFGKEHTGLSGGAPVVYGAGEIQFNKNGLITDVNNGSGHYRPTLAQVERAYQWLVSNGYIPATQPVTRRAVF